MPVRTRYIDAALDGGGAYAGKSYFFLDGAYVRYDWTTDRVDLGPRSLAPWSLTGSFAAGVDGVLEGQAAYAGKVYFWKGAQYCRYDWATDTLDKAPTSTAAWHLPSPFDTGIDAALNGDGPYAGKGYFFKGTQYCRYDWPSDAADLGPASLSAWSLPASMASGVDAALRGQGSYAGKGYFFKGAQYCHYEFATDSPGPARSISDNWPGVAELLQAGAATLVARRWVTAAQTELAKVAAGTAAATSPVMVGLTAHFKSGWPAVLATIRKTFDDLAAVLDAMPARYQYRSHAGAMADHPTAGWTAATVPPAYAAGGTVTYTPNFLNFGPMCQAAMAAHESVHIVDSASGTAATHVYEHAPGYATQATSDAIHNASSYAMLAQQCFFGVDERFGAGRPTE